LQAPEVSDNPSSFDEDDKFCALGIYLDLQEAIEAEQKDEIDTLGAYLDQLENEQEGPEESKDVNLLALPTTPYGERQNSRNEVRIKLYRR